MQPILGLAADLYEWVEQGRVWDTQVLRRLLALATEGHTARGRSSLARSVYDLLGPRAPRRTTRMLTAGQIRTGFGRYLGRPLTDLPPESLAYAGADALATWLLFWDLHHRIKKVLQNAAGIWGYVDAAWLREAIKRFGPLTHHIQLRAAILVDVLRMNGIGIDIDRQAEKLELRSECSRPNARSVCSGGDIWSGNAAAGRHCSRSSRSSSANIGGSN